MSLVLGLRSDQKQKMGCIPFMVYPQEICFSWKKLLSSWHKKPSVKLFKRGTTSLVNLVGMAQPGVKADLKNPPYFYGFKQKINYIFSHKTIQCGEQIRMNEDEYLP